jgi:hypothetical protein
MGGRLCPQPRLSDRSQLIIAGFAPNCAPSAEKQRGSRNVVGLRSPRPPRSISALAGYVYLGEHDVGSEIDYSPRSVIGYRLLHHTAAPRSTGYAGAVNPDHGGGPSDD